MKKLLFLNSLSLSILAIMFMVNCSEQTKVEGKISGIKARVPVDDLLSGRKFTKMAYAGILEIEIENGQKVEAICSEDLLAQLKKCPTFDLTKAEGEKFNAVISISLDSGQSVIMKKNNDTWEVSEIVQ